MAGKSAQAHLDVLARQLGFHDYATYQGYQRHQAMMRAGPAVTSAGQVGAPPPVPQQPPRNWLQQLFDNITNGFTKAGQ